MPFALSEDECHFHAFSSSALSPPPPPPCLKGDEDEGEESGEREEEGKRTRTATVVPIVLRLLLVIVFHTHTLSFPRIYENYQKPRDFKNIFKVPESMLTFFNSSLRMPLKSITSSRIMYLVF